MTPIGQMDRLVTIQQMTETRDSVSKEVTETWATLGKEWIAVEPVKSRSRSLEAFSSNQLSAVTYTVWTMHYRRDMDPEIVNVPKYRRFRYASHVYDIVSAVHVGLREAIELTTLASTKVVA